VTNITEKYVEVELPVAKDAVKCFIRFDHNGETGAGWDGLGLWEYVGEEIGWLQSDPRTPGTRFGPWKLI
jgi:hypothetical protein